MNESAPPVLAGNKLIALATAIVAVLAALGTLFAHHRSISALSAKNEAILAQARATDLYNAYEAKQIRSNIYRALLATELVRSAETRSRLESVARGEESTAPAVLERAKALEQDALRDDDRSEAVMKSYELLQYATTFFQISIVVLSISALASARLLFPFGAGLSAIGLILFAAGLVQSR